MIHKKIQLPNKYADGYEIPLGRINLVFITTDKGMIGCGAFDIVALDSFSYPAARVKSKSGKPIATIDDLLDGIVKDINAGATRFGIRTGMLAKDALKLLSKVK